MGASCAKGSKTTDPDRSPYEPAKKSKGSVKGDESGSGTLTRSGEVEATGEFERKSIPRSSRGEGQSERQKKNLETTKAAETREDDSQRHPIKTSSKDETSNIRVQIPENKRDSTAEKQDDSTHDGEAQVWEPKPKKRAPKEPKPSSEVPTNGDGSRKEVGEKPTERRHRGGEETDGKDGKVKVTDRKRTSLDNDFNVPVKVEGKAEERHSVRKDREGEPLERRKKSEDIVHKRHSREEKRQVSDGIKESDIDVRISERQRSGVGGETGGDGVFRKGLVTLEASAPCGVDMDSLDTKPPGAEGSGRVIRQSQPVSEGVKGGEGKVIRAEPIRIEKDDDVFIPVASTRTHENVTNKEDRHSRKENISPRKKTREDEFEIPPTGLRPVKSRNSNELVTASNIGITSDSATKETASESQKPAKRETSPVATAEPTMAIFGALKGLKTQKPTTPTDDVITTPTGDVTNARLEITKSSPEEKEIVKNRDSAPVVTEKHPANASVAETARFSQPVTTSENSPLQSTQPVGVDARKPIPATRTSILPTPISTEQISGKENQSPPAVNGLVSPTSVKEDPAKSKQERISKLPVKGVSSSGLPGTTSPTAVSSSVKSPPPLSHTSSPLSSSSPSTETKTIESADETKEEGSIKSRSMLLDLTKENKAVIEIHPICPNTRTKLLQAVDKWFGAGDKDKENASRVMAISGKPGIGKTCLAAELCRRFSAQLAGAHFFQFLPDRLDQNFAKTMLLSIAMKLSEVFPTYSALLPAPEELQQVLSESELFDLFEALITRPLQSLSPGNQMIVIVDALDECYPSDRDHLLRLINEFEKKTPDWLYLFCTIRDDNQMTGKLDRVHTIELKGTSDAMTGDLKRYLRDPMSRLIDRISLDGALGQLAGHSQGTFLAAYLLKKKLENLPDGTALALRDVTMFPSGFGEICKEFFQRYYDHFSQKYSAKEAPALYGGVLGILAIARGKLNKAFVTQVNGKLDAVDDLAPIHGLLDIDDDGSVGFHHKSITEWLLSEQTAAPLAVNISNARQKMADSVLVWLAPILEDSTSNSATIPTQLQQYALKNAVSHLTEVQKQQDSVARLLCSLSYIQEKLTIPGVTLDDLLRDYTHSHYQITGTTSKLVTLDSYMKRLTNFTEQVEAYHGFVRTKGNLISRYPKHLLQFAANYPTVTRIQENARLDLADKPWLEDVTAAAETPSIQKLITGRICSGDLSNDNKTLAVLAHDDQKVLLYLLNVVSGDMIGEPIDVSSISDRSGTCVRFLPDNNHLFIGSLTNLVAVKNWKAVPSGYDCQSIQLKERYSIDCCDAGSGYLACGVGTLPGRSLYMVVFDLKTKVAKTLEVLKFRFGGSPQFGIKTCAISADGSMLCACYKQASKFEMKATVWTTGNWNILHSIDIENDRMTRCYFIGNHSVVISAGMETPENHQHAYFWSLQEKRCTILPAGKHDISSVGYLKNSQLTLIHRSHSSAKSTVSRWKKDATRIDCPDERHILNSDDEFGDMLATEKSLIFLFRSSIRIYRIADLAPVSALPAAESFTSCDSVIESLTFISRSDEPVVVCHDEGDPTGGVCASRISVKNDGALHSNVLFSGLQVEQSGHREVKSRIFKGPGSSSEVIACTPDGSTVVFNTGDSVRVLDISSGSQRSLPDFGELIVKPSIVKDAPPVSYITCVLSSKDSLTGILYPEKPESVFLYDLKTKASEPALELQMDGSSSSKAITDFAFIPSNGYVIAYQQVPEQSLVVWNQRNGTQISSQAGLDIMYIRQSPSSDRLALSIRREGGTGGSLILRSSDNRFNISLESPPSTAWVPAVGCGDVEFSGDGTVLLGMFVKNKIIRIWNAGNGESLKDLELSFISPAMEIVGMLTNTHAVLNAGSMLYVCDIDSSGLVALIHSSDPLTRKLSSRGLKISPKGNVIAGSTVNSAELKVFQCHNLSSVKRKTTLQLFRNK